MTNNMMGLGASLNSEFDGCPKVEGVESSGRRVYGEELRASTSSLVVKGWNVVEGDGVREDWDGVVGWVSTA